MNEIVHSGVTWRHEQTLRVTEEPIECDLLIVCRHPWLAPKVRATKTVLWVQDFLTDVGKTWDFSRFSEIWCVSWWQSCQWQAIAEEERIKLPPIHVTRNGIARHNLGPVKRDPHQLAFCSRPERGLLPLVRRGGILDQFPGLHLKVCGYPDYPSQHALFYKDLWAMCADHPRVEVLGSLTNQQVRHLLASSVAMVMPTNYAETSCMLAREAIDVLTPVICTAADPDPAKTTGSGALPETLGAAGFVIKSDSEWNDDRFIQQFSTGLEYALNYPVRMKLKQAMILREDLYWENVARQWLYRSQMLLNGANLARL